MRVVEVVQIVLERISQQSRLSGHQIGELQLLKVGGDKDSFHLPVHRVRRGVSLGIRPNPSIVMNGGVHGIGAVSDIVPQPSGIENRVGLGEVGVAMIEQRAPVFAESHHQPLVNLDRNVRLQPDSFGQKILRLARRLCALGRKFAIETVTIGRKFHAVDHLQIDEVIGLLRTLQSQLRSFAPAIRLGSEIGELSASVAQKRRDIRRQLFGGHAVDGAVAFVAPRPGRRYKKC